MAKPDDIQTTYEAGGYKICLVGANPLIMHKIQISLASLIKDSQAKTEDPSEKFGRLCCMVDACIDSDGGWMLGDQGVEEYVKMKNF